MDVYDFSVRIIYKTPTERYASVVFENRNIAKAVILLERTEALPVSQQNGFELIDGEGAGRSVAVINSTAQ